MQHFTNKVVVITGAGSGMGRAYALAFAKRGAKLALNDFDAAGLAQTNALLKEAGVTELYTEAFDVGNKDAMYAFASRAAEALGNAHVLINNAGIGGGGIPVWDMPEAVYEHTIQINLFGVIYGTRAFLPQLLANGEGAIINISSVFGLLGTPNTSDYCAAKFGVCGFTESLMVELHDSPISVHLVHPGGINTNIAKATPNSEEFTRKYLKTDPAAVAEKVIEGIVRDRPRIILGHGSRLLWALSTLIPLRLRTPLMYKIFKGIVSQDTYESVRRL